MDPELHHPRLWGLEHWLPVSLSSLMLSLGLALQGAPCGCVLRSDSISLDPLLGLCEWRSLTFHSVDQVSERRTHAAPITATSRCSSTASLFHRLMPTVP